MIVVVVELRVCEAELRHDVLAHHLHLVLGKELATAKIQSQVIACIYLLTC